MAVKETLKSYHDVKRRVRILQDLVETYVYPEIANELLVQRGILGDDRIDDEKVRAAQKEKRKNTYYQHKSTLFHFGLAKTADKRNRKGIHRKPCAQKDRR